MRTFALFCLLALARSSCAQTPATALRRNVNTDTAKVYKDVEQMPTFSGSWDKYLQEHIDFPAAVLNRLDSDTTLTKTRFEEQVVAQFIICEDGGLCNVKVIQCNPAYPELGKEVLRVLQLSPVWNPGLINGRPVKTYFTLPVTFSAQ